VTKLCKGLLDNVIEHLNFNMSIRITYHNIFNTVLEFYHSEDVFVPYCFIHTSLYVICHLHFYLLCNMNLVDWTKDKSKPFKSFSGFYYSEFKLQIEGV
jgi:hypothetical protein